MQLHKLMKQTNNALKFLLAQYRAIFKSAYVKGLAAAVLTAGMAVSAAQTANAAETLSGDAFQTLTGEVNIDSGDQWNNLNLDGTTGTGITNNNITAINITVQSGANSVKGTVTTNNAIWNFHDSGTSSTTIGSGGAATTLTAKGWDVNTADTITLSGGAGAGSGTSVLLQTLSLTSGTITLTSTASSGSIFLSANTITANVGDGVTINLSGADATNQTIVHGQLDGAGTHKYNVADSKFGTLEVWTAEGSSANVDITVGASGADMSIAASGSEDDGTTWGTGTLNIQSGTISIANSNTAGSGGSLTITAGTIELGNQVTLQSSGNNTSGTASVIVSGSSADAATLKLASTTLQSFFSGDGTSTQAGALDLTKGTLFLTDNVNLNTFTYTTTSGSAGAIYASGAGNAVIAGDELTMTTKLENASDLYVEATKLNLTELSDTDNAYGVGRTTAKEYVLTLNTAANGTTPADNAFTVNHDMVYASTQEVNNPYQVQGADPADPTTITVAGTGTIGSNLLVTGASGSLTIAAGHYTTANDIELASSGSLTVGGQEATSKYAGIDASLTLQNGASLTLNNSGTGGPNEITITGNGDSDPWSATATHTSSSVLDLTQGSIALAVEDITGSEQAQVQTNITVSGGGELILRDDQFNYLLNNVREAERIDLTTISGSSLNLAGGLITVEGDVDIDISAIAAAANTNGKLNFDTTSGGVLAANTITITEADQDPSVLTDTGTPLNLGSLGTLRADVVSLHNHSINATNDNYVDYQITSGNIEVGSAFRSDNPTVIFGDGSSGASLKLGYINENVDEYGIGLGTYTTSAATGEVNTNLKFNGGADTNASQLNVEFGDWAIQDLEASNATITVGQNTALDANGDPYAASLTGWALKLNTGAEMTVNRSARHLKLSRW